MEDLEEIYEKALENMPPVDEATANYYKKMKHYFESYISAYEKQIFLYGYLCGIESTKK